MDYQNFDESIFCSLFKTAFAYVCMAINDSLELDSWVSSSPKSNNIALNKILIIITVIVTNKFFYYETDNLSDHQLI